MPSRRASRKDGVDAADTILTLSTLDYSTNISGVPRDSYELFWDDADRLIAVKITMPACRGSTAPPFGCTHLGYNSATWNYHYLGSRLIGATRTGGGGTRRLWAVTDERGLVYRLMDQTGSTYWQAPWDASGQRTVVGSTPEMFVPFGLPGQVILDTMSIADDGTGSSPTSNIGTEAFASGTGGTWTRPPIALNRWRAYDPLSGAFLQPDMADLGGRLTPEGYAAFRHTPTTLSDATGGDAAGPVPDMWRGGSSDLWAEMWRGIKQYVGCTEEQRALIAQAVSQAIVRLAICVSGQCANPNIKRNWLYSLQNAQYHCTGVPGTNNGGNGQVLDLATQKWVGGLWAKTWVGGMVKQDTWIAPAQFTRPLVNSGTNPCLAGLIAHESAHPWTFYLDLSGAVVSDGSRGLGPAVGSGGGPGTIRNILYGEPNPATGNRPSLDESYIEQAITDCKVCGP